MHTILSTLAVAIFPLLTGVLAGLYARERQRRRRAERDYQALFGLCARQAEQVRAFCSDNAPGALRARLRLANASERDKRLRALAPRNPVCWPKPLATIWPN